jgi:hypothetical protein
MRRIAFVAALAASALAAASIGAAGAAAQVPVLQQFQIRITNQISRATARGLAVNDAGTATARSPTSYSLSFPSGPGNLFETPTSTVGGLDAGCVERLTQTGTFVFFFLPNSAPGIEFVGSGSYTQTSTTIYRSLAGGGCDTSRVLLRNVTVNAGATEVGEVA